MIKIDLKNKTSEKLNSELELIKIIIGMLIGALSLLVGICIYGLLAKDNNGTFISLLVVAFTTSLIIPSGYGYLKKIKEELKSRV
jgi:hypothetical protein